MMRAAGKSFDAIADALGYASRSGAHKAVDSAMKKCQHEGVDQLRALHSVRLSEIMAALWDRRKDAQTARAIVYCMEREARLFGMDAPTKLQLEQVLASEDWARVRDAIKRALTPWPEAAEAGAAALRGIDND